MKKVGEAIRGETTSGDHGRPSPHGSAVPPRSPHASASCPSDGLRHHSENAVLIGIAPWSIINGKQEMSFQADGTPLRCRRSFHHSLPPLLAPGWPSVSPLPPWLFFFLAPGVTLPFCQTRTATKRRTSRSIATTRTLFWWTTARSTSLAAKCVSGGLARPGRALAVWRAWLLFFALDAPLCLSPSFINTLVRTLADYTARQH